MNVALGFTIRAERPQDAAEIRDVVAAAFPAPAEADLVDRLRRDGDIVLSLVALESDRIIGAVIFSRMSLNDIVSDRIVALAPLAVHPGFQRRGVGTALVRRGHEILTQRGAALSLVLGDPAYYGRFGYSAAEAAAYRTPHDGPHLMALRLSTAAPRDGELAYARAFAGLA